MSFRNSVGARLMLAFAGVIIVFGAAVALSIGRLAAFNSTMIAITGPDITKVELATAWQDAISESMRHTRNMLILDDKAQIQDEMDKTRALSEKEAKYAQDLTALVASAEGKAMLKTTLDAHALLVPRPRRPRCWIARAPRSWHSGSRCKN
jgi:hypothetical protein